MVSVSELVVAIRGDGIDETEQDLEGMNETVQESSEELSEQAGMMEQLGGEFAGALGVAVTGLAVASAGLLSQVPVLGQLFQGLFAVVQSLALTMDTVLRPVLGPISSKLFDLSAAIAGTEGKGRKLVGVLTTLGVVLTGALAAAIKFAGAAAVFGKIAGAATTAASVIVGAITTIAGILSLPVSATAALVAGVVALLAVLLTDFRGWRTKAINIFTSVGGDIIDGFINAFNAAKQRVITVITNLIEKAKKLISDFFEDIRNIDITGNVSGDTTFGRSVRGGRRDMSSSEAKQVPSPRETTNKIYLNGREVGRGTGGERFDESARRGQTF